ncbi:Maf family protein [Salipaludibacillus aurantiacus]|uniref:dTTP/UTP pyrophosphatase n=1 Tax=Salipaludibacillus aurantiacus TaxID=1601833 RepID=A0A1H9T790_9BACI|nr:Maf family protein [Salipaludibacillus aurantiacus]SER92443.1 septum formation protein [Salipaludibacillus aurantiacus]
MKPFILASQSPRRKQLLEQAGLSFSIIPSSIEETVPNHYSPEETVALLAYQKAADVLKDHRDSVVLGADTIVSLDGTILGKPANDEDARAKLHLLSGRTHQVLTGVAILSSEKEVTFTAQAQVSFYSLSDEEIDNYIRSGEPSDKAGAYGIQGLGATFVEKVEGDYFAIVGLPIAKVSRALKSFN